MKIAVLGRGKSLKRYKALGYDKLYLVNDMTEEVKRIRLTLFDAKEIIHVCGRKGATVMTGDTYHNLGINRIVVNAISLNHIENIKRHKQNHKLNLEIRSAAMAKRGYPPIGWSKLLRGVKSAAKKSTNGNCWPTTGLFAIDLALTENLPEEIHLWGFDFYKRAYMVKPNRSYQTQRNPKVKMMYKCLGELIYEYNGVDFHCHSDILGDVD